MIQQKKSTIATAILMAMICMTTIGNMACAQKSGKKKTAKKETKSQNEISLTMNGMTKTFSNQVNAVVIDGQFMGIINADGSAKVGDSEKLSAKAGSTKSGSRIVFDINGQLIFDTGESCSITITYYDGKIIKGTFKADLHDKAQGESKHTIATGTFQTTDILIL
jgi:hypothetical protein